MGAENRCSRLVPAALGEGYKATDTRLDRTVASTVLPEYVAADPDLKQWFEREASTRAALNDAHFSTDLGDLWLVRWESGCRGAPKRSSTLPLIAYYWEAGSGHLAVILRPSSYPEHLAHG